MRDIALFKKDMKGKILIQKELEEKIHGLVTAFDYLKDKHNAVCLSKGIGLGIALAIVFTETTGPLIPPLMKEACIDQEIKKLSLEFSKLYKKYDDLQLSVTNSSRLTSAPPLPYLLTN